MTELEAAEARVRELRQRACIALPFGLAPERYDSSGDARVQLGVLSLWATPERIGALLKYDGSSMTEQQLLETADAIYRAAGLKVPERTT